MMTKRGLEILFRGVAVLGVVFVLLPVAAFPFVPAFPGRTAGMFLYLAACVERTWAMYFRAGVRSAGQGAGRDWTAVAVGYAYVLTLGGAAVEFLLRGRGLSVWPVVGGGAAYGVGVALRYWAFHVLRHQWRVDVTDTGGPRHLVREGPYRHVRHPLYLGACLEAIGLPVMLGAWGALAFGALVFIPLEVARAYYEERFLRGLFGAEYKRYAESVRAFLPLPFRPRRGS